MLSVNVARVRTNPDPHALSKVTGIDKVAATEPIMVRAPGPMHGGVGSGLVGDTIGNQKFHGGDDQAVYVYAREDLDAWEIQLKRNTRQRELRRESDHLGHRCDGGADR